MEPRKPDLYVLNTVLLVEDRVHYQLGAVGLDHSAGVLLTKYVHKVRACLESRDGSEVWCSSVYDTASEDGDPATLALVQGVGQSWHERSGCMLQFLFLQRTKTSFNW